MDVAPGDVVAVPLGPRECTGVVWAREREPHPGLDNRLKDIADKLDVPPLKPSCASSSTGSSDYTLARAAWCCAWRCAWASISAPERERVGVRLAGPPPQRMTAARNARAGGCSPTALCAARARSRRRPASRAGVIDGLVDEGTLETLVLPPEPVARAPDPDFAQPDFSPAQRAAADALRATSQKGGYLGDAARRRHRLGQDRGLFRGGGGNDPRAAGRR